MKISGPAGLILAFLILVGGMAGAWFLYAKPQVDGYEKLVDERNASMEKTQYYQGKIDEINTTGVDYLGDLYRKAQIVDRLLPGTVDRGAVALEYTARARSMGLVVNSFTPGEEGEGFETFQGEFTGSYDSVGAWVDYIENASNLITIESMAVKGATSDEGQGGYSLTMTLKFHTFSEPGLEESTQAGN